MSLEIPKGGMAGLEGNWILGPGKEKPAGGAAGFTTNDSTGVNLIRNYVVANADPQAENDNPEWPAPVDLNGRLGAPALKKGLIPEGLESFVWDRAEALGVDPGVIAMGCIVTCAAAISDDIKIQPKEHDHTWTESARLWAAIVGNPSTKKTPGLEQAVKPARRLDMEASEDAVGPMEQFGLDVQIYKKQLQRYTSAVAKGDDSAPAPSKPTKPVCRRLVVQDTTTEALSEVLAENDRGLLVFVDELSGFFGSMDAYRGGTGLNKDRPLWLQAYNGGRATFDRIGRGQVIVPNWSTCVLGGIQPDPMRRIAKNIDDDGLLQRFMIVCARPAERDVDRPANLDAINGYRDLVRGLYAINKGAETCNYTLSKEAHTYRVKVADFAHQCLITGDVLGSPLSAHLGKWGGLFARLVLTFHLIEYTAKGHQAPYVIAEGTARKMHDFMTGYLFLHSLHFYHEILGLRVEVGQADDIAGFILAKQLSEITVRDITRGVWSLKGKPTSGIQAAMEPLVNFSWAEPVEGKNGKPSNRWLINPAVHVLFKERAEAEKKAREARRTVVDMVFGKGAVA